jgi:hypothetical protein
MKQRVSGTTQGKLYKGRTFFRRLAGTFFLFSFVLGLPHQVQGQTKTQREKTAEAFVAEGADLLQQGQAATEKFRRPFASRQILPRPMLISVWN